MSNIDYGGVRRYEYVGELANAGVDAIERGVTHSSIPAMIEHYNGDISKQLDDTQLDVLVGDVRSAIATTVMADSGIPFDYSLDYFSELEPTSYNADFLVNAGMLTLAEDDPIAYERACEALAIASSLMTAAMEDNAGKDFYIRSRLLNEHFLRVLRKQVDIEDVAGSNKTAAVVAEVAWSQFQETINDTDEATTIDSAARKVREAARHMEGGIANERAQYLLRETSDKLLIFDPVEAVAAAEVGKQLLMSGMIDPGLNVLAKEGNFDAEAYRARQAGSNELSPVAIENYISMMHDAVSMMPWYELHTLQLQDGSSEYVNRVLDRMNERYPTTLQMIGRLDVNSALDVLIYAGRTADVGIVIRSKHDPTKEHNDMQVAGVAYAAGYKLGYQDKVDDRDAISAEIQHINVAAEELLEGYTDGLDRASKEALETHS